MELRRRRLPQLNEEAAQFSETRVVRGNASRDAAHELGTEGGEAPHHAGFWAWVRQLSSTRVCHVLTWSHTAELYHGTRALSWGTPLDVLRTRRAMRVLDVLRFAEIE